MEKLCDVRFLFGIAECRMLGSGAMKKQRPYAHLKDDALLTETIHASSREKTATLELLEYLAEVDRRKAFAIGAFSSLFDYVVRGLGYSETQAAERVNTVRLMRSLDPVWDHLQSGALNLTNAAKIQRHFQAEKKLAQDLPIEQKLELVEQCLHQPKREVEKILLAEASEPVAAAMSERIRLITPERVELKFCIEDRTRSKLDRVRELVGTQTLEAIFDAALDAYLAQEEQRRQTGRAARSRTAESAKQAPARTKSALPAKSPSRPSAPPARGQTRYIPIQVRRSIYRRAGSQCEYRCEQSGERCPSRYRLQFDHIVPYSKGGLTEIHNLRLLCPEHNQRMAIQAGVSAAAE